MPKQIILNQITLCADGSIGIQWLKQVTDPDTNEVLFSEPHRSVVDFDGDAGAQIDSVADHLKSMGYAVSGKAAARFKQLVGRVVQIADADAEITNNRNAKIDVKAKASLAAAKAEAEAAAQPPQKG